MQSSQSRHAKILNGKIRLDAELQIQSHALSHERNQFITVRRTFIAILHNKGTLASIVPAEKPQSVYVQIGKDVVRFQIEAHLSKEEQVARQIKIGADIGAEKVRKFIVVVDFTRAESFCCRI